MILRSPTKHEIEITVMPAWMAGIQARKDASGNVHVNLDSSSPCWNDVIEGALLKLTEAPPSPIFKGVREGHEGWTEFLKDFVFLRALRVLRGAVESRFGCGLCRAT